MRAGSDVGTRSFGLGLQLLGFCVFIGISAGGGMALLRGAIWWVAVGTGGGIAAGIAALYVFGRGAPELPGH